MTNNITLDLEQSFGGLNECVMITSADRSIVFANKAMEDLVKTKREDLIGTTTERFFADPAEFEKIGELYNSPEDQRYRKAYKFDIKDGEGTKIPLEVVSAPLFNKERELCGLLFIARDVSERVALETKLSDVAVTLEDALEAISEGFAIYDSEDRLIICNDNYRDIYAESAPAMFPGNRFEDILRFGLTKKQYNTGEESDEEWLNERLDRHNNADGSVVEQLLSDGRWLRISETRTMSGSIAGIRADITELKLARAQAESAFQNLSLIADNICASITEVDLEGKCLFVNKTGCQWFGGTQEELIGTRLRNRLPWKERELVKLLFEKAQAGQTTSEEVCFHFPDGVTRESQIDCNPRINEDGEVQGLVVMITDITDRKKTERTLAELYGITSTRELGHEDKIAEILRLGCEHFDLPFGVISHVIDDHYNIMYAQSPNGELAHGMSFPLKDTYCSLTLAADGPIATPNAALSEFAKHPCYEIFS
ncbi:MAG: PAS domain S-box protein, partial [Hyphomicrobiales bacterium]